MPCKDIENRRRIQALSRRKRNAERREDIIIRLGSKCVRCGYDDKRALVIDHVNGGGTKERKEVAGGFYSLVIKKLKEGTDEYQLLCCNCNNIKSIDEKTPRKY